MIVKVMTKIKIKKLYNMLLYNIMNKVYQHVKIIGGNCSSLKPEIKRTIKSIKNKTNSKTKKISNIYEYNYKKDNKLLKNTDELNKIRIPPNYKNVSICVDDNKVLGYGYDEKNRKQVIYQPEFREKQQKSKHQHLLLLGGKYHEIIKKINEDFKQNNDIKTKLIALCLILIKECDFRVSSSRKKALEYQHFGVTTLLCEHIKLNNNIVDIEFIGKKGVLNKCSLDNKNVFNYFKILKKQNCNKKDNFIFKYNDKFIEAKDINLYLKQFGNITTKNFRTWNANTHLIKDIMDYKKTNYNQEKEQLQKKTFSTKKINELVDNVAFKLHNTRAVCKKEYLNPQMLSQMDNDMNKFIQKINLNNDQHKNYLDILQQL